VSSRRQELSNGNHVWRGQFWWKVDTTEECPTTVNSARSCGAVTVCWDRLVLGCAGLWMWPLPSCIWFSDQPATSAGCAAAAWHGLAFAARAELHCSAHVGSFWTVPVGLGHHTGERYSSRFSRVSNYKPTSVLVPASGDVVCDGWLDKHISSLCPY